MIDLVVFILCCGEQKRFPPGMLKQTLSIDGQPLIERTVQQVRSLYQAEPWVCVRSGQPFGIGVRYFYPSDYTWIFDTVMSTSGQWGHNNIILLGDVYYTPNALMLIRNSPEFAYGTKGEIFAIKFQRGEIVHLSRSAAMARAEARNGGQGKLWNLYRAWEGMSQKTHDFGPSFRHMPEDDETQDFDQMESYQNFIMRREGLSV